MPFSEKLKGYPFIQELCSCIKGYPFIQELCSCIKNSVNAPTKHRVRPNHF